MRQHQLTLVVVLVVLVAPLLVMLVVPVAPLVVVLVVLVAPLLVFLVALVVLVQKGCPLVVSSSPVQREHHSGSAESALLSTTSPTYMR
jgi:hypothetical protein